MVLFQLLLSCGEKKQSVIGRETNDMHSLVGSWKMIYADILENDSLQIKDITASDFIKIINKDHFAFFNQPKCNAEGFYGGGGRYSLKGDQYIETLEYIGVENLRGHDFSFTIELKGDTLIQYGLEEIKKANIERYITEKYIRFN